MNEAGGEPKQHFEAVQPEPGSEDLKQPAEKESPASEASAGKQPPPPAIQPLPVIPDVPVAQLPALPQTEDTAAPVSSPKTSKLPAADSDLIEKQWVQKAKEIVAETKSDPYKQKSEMSKIKADYIGKRYNKAIKTDDAVTAWMFC